MEGTGFSSVSARKLGNETKGRGELGSPSPPFIYMLMKNGSIHSKIRMSYLLPSYSVCPGCATNCICCYLRCRDCICRIQLMITLSLQFLTFLLYGF